MDVSLMPIRSMAPLIMARLRKVFPENKFQLDRVPSILTLNEFERLTRQSPFLGLAFAGMKPDGASGRRLLCKYQWRLVIILKATGNFNRRFCGDARDFGLDDLTDVATAILHGHTLPDIGACAVTGLETVYAEGWSDQATVLAHINFEVMTALAAGDLRLETPEDFESIHAVWLLDADDAEKGDHSNGTDRTDET